MRFILKVITIQIRWRQQKSSFNLKLDKLKGVWNNMLLILLTKYEKKDEIFNEQEKQELYYLKYISKISEFSHYKFSIENKILIRNTKTDVLSNYLKKKFEFFYKSMSEYLKEYKFQKKSKVILKKLFILLPCQF